MIQVHRLPLEIHHPGVESDAGIATVSCGQPLNLLFLLLHNHRLERCARSAPRGLRRCQQGTVNLVSCMTILLLVFAASFFVSYAAQGTLYKAD